MSSGVVSKDSTLATDAVSLPITSMSGCLGYNKADMQVESIA